MNKDKIRGILLLFFGLLPYLIIIFSVINITITGTTDCLIDLGPETNCNMVYGFDALKMALSMLLVICVVWWYIAIPIMIISVLWIVKGIKLLTNKEKQH